MKRMDGGRKRGAEQGSVLVLTLWVVLVLSLLGATFVMLTLTGSRSAGAQAASTSSLYVADSGLNQIVALQNDIASSPRYLFDPDSYQTEGVNPLFVDFDLVDPTTGQSVGRSVRRVVNDKNPLVDPPPYRVESAAFVRNAVRRVEADIAPRSLLEYAVWSEATVYVAPAITIGGKMYSAGTIHLTGSPITFLKDLEYVSSLVNEDYGTYFGPVTQLDEPHPSLTTLVDLGFYEDAGKGSGVCGDGTGLYIGSDAGHQNNDLFYRSSGWYQIDLTLFDLSGPSQDPPQPITYNGEPLLSFGAGEPIEDFSGIIFVDGKLSIWGQLGGRSVEDSTVLDDDKPLSSSYNYPGPNGAGQNLYSNNRLDAGEDGMGGGDINGILDPRELGQSLTIVTKSAKDIVIEHNIFMGQSPEGAPVRMALISGDALYVASDSPKTIVIQAALLARDKDTYSWQPLGSSSSHQNNYWAEDPDGDYIYDLDFDGTIESNNGAPQSSDRDETDMLSAWSLTEHGNLITKGRPVSGIWASASHIRQYVYDSTLMIAEPPCYPVLAVYGVVPGSWTEVY